MPNKHSINKIWATFSSISLSLCGEMALTLLKRPLLIIPTVWATIECTLISEKLFKKASTGNGIGNAFKHALWNAIIALYCQRFYSNPDRPLAWAKKITDLHENCLPNKEKDRQMDLFNNSLGREIYLEIYQELDKKIKKKDVITVLNNNLDKMMFLS